MNQQDINLDEVLRKMALISCDVLSRKSESPDIRNRFDNIKKRLKDASPQEIRALSYEIQELKSVGRIFK